MVKTNVYLIGGPEAVRTKSYTGVSKFILAPELAGKAAGVAGAAAAAGGAGLSPAKAVEVAAKIANDRLLIAVFIKVRSEW